MNLSTINSIQNGRLSPLYYVYWFKTLLFSVWLSYILIQSYSSILCILWGLQLFKLLLKIKLIFFNNAINGNNDEVDTIGEIMYFGFYTFISIFFHSIILILMSNLYLINVNMCSKHLIFYTLIDTGIACIIFIMISIMTCLMICKSNKKELKLKIIMINNIKKWNQIDRECCICKKEFILTDYAYLLPCNHHDHKECLDKWFNITKICPRCKQKLKC